MNDLIEQSCTDFKTRIEALKGKITCNKPAKKHIVYGEPTHFRLILSNLIDNAIKYSDRAPEIGITAENTNNKEIRLSVADKGIGIEKKHLDQIFEKYYRVSTGNIHNVKGFGLGLTYVKKLVEYYKGEIKVSSTLGVGTVFTIVLPLINEEDENSVG
jgi:two-component system phosphate regulon sensor histidine kinase PhoR